MKKSKTILILLFAIFLLYKINPVYAQKWITTDVKVIELSGKDNSFSLLFKFSSPQFKEQTVVDYAVLSFTATVLEASKTDEINEILLEVLNDNISKDHGCNIHPATAGINRKAIGKKNVSVDITEIISFDKNNDISNHGISVISHRRASDSSLNPNSIDTTSGYEPVSVTIFYTKVED